MVLQLHVEFLPAASSVLKRARSSAFCSGVRLSAGVSTAFWDRLADAGFSGSSGSLEFVSDRRDDPIPWPTLLLKRSVIVIDVVPSRRLLEFKSCSVVEAKLWINRPSQCYLDQRR